MSSASKRTVPAAQFMPQHQNRNCHWVDFDRTLWGMTCHKKSEDEPFYIFPPWVQGVREDGQAAKNGVHVGDLLIAFRIKKLQPWLPDNPAHYIFNQNGRIDAVTHGIFDNPQALSFFVHMPNRCGLPNCLGRVEEIHDSTDHYQVCQKCGTVHRTGMQGTTPEKLSEVQEEQQRLHRLSGPLKQRSEASKMRTETIPSHSFSRIAQPLRQAMRTEDKDTFPAAGRNIHVQHEMLKAQKFMQQIVSVLLLTPAVLVSALQVFKSYVDTKKKSLSDTAQVCWYQKIVVACIFIAANMNKTPRTIWHVISSLKHEEKIDAVAVTVILREIDPKYNEFKYITPIYLVETMCLFHECLKPYSQAAKQVLQKFAFKRNPTVEVKVAVGFAFASASTSNKCNVAVLEIMKE